MRQTDEHVGAAAAALGSLAHAGHFHEFKLFNAGQDMARGSDNVRFSRQLAGIMVSDGPGIVLEMNLAGRDQPVKSGNKMFEFYPMGRQIIFSSEHGMAIGTSGNNFPNTHALEHVEVSLSEAFRQLDIASPIRRTAATPFLRAGVGRNTTFFQDLQGGLRGLRITISIIAAAEKEDLGFWLALAIRIVGITSQATSRLSDRLSQAVS